jgi:TPR repeat protein
MCWRRRCRSPVTIQRDSKRARIVLLAAAGRNTRSIANGVGVQPRRANWPPLPPPLPTSHRPRKCLYRYRSRRASLRLNRRYGTSLQGIWTAMNWHRCFSGRTISSSSVISLQRGFCSGVLPKRGDARAAFTLAGTFDPNVLKALGLQDGVPDLALARLWYERAAQLGSADAPRRLQQLVTASVP